ncbi:MAG: HEAT repeat domain-containing protein [Pirellulales bacterium]
MAVTAVKSTLEGIRVRDQRTFDSGKQYDGHSFAEWLRRLADQDRRKEAEVALGQFIINDPAILDELLDAYDRAENICVATGIIRAFEHAGSAAKRAVPALLDVVHSAGLASFRLFAHRAIVAIGPAGLPHLETALRGDNRPRRATAAAVARDLGDAAKPLIPLLYALLDDPHRSVRLAAASTLTKLENRYVVAVCDEPSDEWTKQRVEKLLKLLTKSNLTLREIYVQIEGYLTPKNVAVVMSLLPAPVLEQFREHAQRLPRTPEERSKLLYINCDRPPDDTLAALIDYFDRDETD